MYVFDPRLLKVVTPLNFAYYSKYVLEEILIVPILAVLQKSDRLARIHPLVHSFEWSHVQFKEFLRSSFPGLITFVEVGLPDSEYSVFEPATKDCHNIIYLQNYFTVNSKKILGIAEKVPEYSLAFTLNAYYKE